MPQRFQSFWGITSLLPLEKIHLMIDLNCFVRARVTSILRKTSHQILIELAKNYNRILTLLTYPYHQSKNFSSFTKLKNKWSWDKLHCLWMLISFWHYEHFLNNPDCNNSNFNLIWITKIAGRLFFMLYKVVIVCSFISRRSLFNRH